MLRRPETKYRPFSGPDLPDRTWPSRRIERAPVWLSTDLRDGNQALADPMDVARKLRLWDTLVAMGFKEIEVAFPSASETDFAFVRRLIEEDRIPEDVTIQVLVQAREDLIRRTFDALAGAPRAIVHVYTALSPVFREVVFRKGRAEMKALAVTAMALARDLAAARPETHWRFQYSPETFSTTELEYAREVVDAVTEVVGPTPEWPLIVNLPATVEAATPNVFADQVEWMHRSLARREAITLSVHTHNDRGTAVAAAELALMAGADRVEGCLFGNGERTGNVCLVTLAMNLYSQGVDPGLDLSDLDGVCRVAEGCTRIPVHPRHPYAGELVHTAFSGSHQDAIRKGFAAQDPAGPWRVPYLPVDPADVGRDYRAVIRVNSQSGKGGIAHVLERDHGLQLPRGMQIELGRGVQALTERHGRELTAEEIHQALVAEFAEPGGPWTYVSHHLDEDTGASPEVTLEVALRRNGVPETVRGRGHGPIEAFVAGLDGVRVLDYHEHAIGAGADAEAAAYVALGFAGGETVWGMGRDGNILTASLRAMVSALNRHALAAGSGVAMAG